jgi:hypothetical protein
MKKTLATLLVVASITGVTAAGASAPRGLTSYGRISWNLDALVRNFYGGSRTCFRVQSLTIHRCGQPGFDDGLYQATFATAHRSGFHAVRTSNPLTRVNAVGIRIGGRYISCGNGTWLAMTNAPAGWGEGVACVRP